MVFNFFLHLVSVSFYFEDLLLDVNTIKILYHPEFHILLSLEK